MNFIFHIPGTIFKFTLTINILMWQLFPQGKWDKTGLWNEVRVMGGHWLCIAVFIVVPKKAEYDNE